MLESLDHQQILLLTISVSLFSFTIIFGYTLLSIFDGAGFITPTASISGAAMVGALFGITHGLLTGLFLIWRKFDSIINLLAGSVLATEIISLLFVVALLFVNRKEYTFSLFAVMSFSDYLSAFINLITVFLFVSFLLLVPAILIALINRLILFYFVK